VQDDRNWSVPGYLSQVPGVAARPARARRPTDRPIQVIRARASISAWNGPLPVVPYVAELIYAVGNRFSSAWRAKVTRLSNKATLRSSATSGEFRRTRAVLRTSELPTISPRDRGVTMSRRDLIETERKRNVRDVTEARVDTDWNERFGEAQRLLVFARLAKSRISGSRGIFLMVLAADKRISG